MKEYNPKIIGTSVHGCVMQAKGVCISEPIRCPIPQDDGKVAIPADCPAREGIIIKVKE